MAIKLTSSKLTKDLARNTKLVHHIDRALNKWDGPISFEYSAKLGDDAFHPSGHCTPSTENLVQMARAWKPAAKGTVAGEAVAPNLRKAFLVGHFWHAFLQHILTDVLDFAPTYAIERRGIHGWGEVGDLREQPNGVKTGYRPFHWATGSADVAPCHVPGQGDWLVDFKTMNARHFAKSLPPDDYGDKWEAQLNIYMDWFDLEQAMIVGVCKDSPHDFKEFHYRRNDRLIGAIYDKWEYVGYFLDNPDLIPNADDDIVLPFEGNVE